MVYSHKYFWHTVLGSAFFVGILFFLIYHQWLIVHFNTGNSFVEEKISLVEKKPVRLHFWQNNAWHHEDAEVLWSTDVAQNIHYLTNRWLSLVDEENVYSKKIVAQTVTLSPSGQEAYVSFDRYPFEEESSTYEKYMFIEGLLKTLRERDIKIYGLYFLVHHRPIEDYHLDFSHYWPLKSFQSS
jgi:hypothetical protein